MLYELTHDTIAKQVFQKASTEARTRRKMERYIRERYQAFQERGTQLTQDDIDYVWPYMEVVNSSEEELAFLRTGRQRLRYLRRRRQLILLGVTAAFAILGLWANWQRQKAVEREAQNASMRIGLEASYELNGGQPARAFRLAEAVLDRADDEEAQRIALEVIKTVQATPLVRELAHEATITALQFDQSGNRILSAALNGEARVSSLAGDILARFTHDGGVVWGQWLGSKELLCLTEGHRFSRWQIDSQSEERFAAGGAVGAVALLDSTLLAVGAGDRIRIWSVEQAGTNLIQEIEAGAAVVDLVFLAQESSFELVSIDASGRAVRWGADGSLRTEYRNPRSAPIAGVSTDATATKLAFRTAAGDFLRDLNDQRLEENAAILFQAVQPLHSTFSVNNERNRLVSLSRDSNEVFVFNFKEDGGGLDMQYKPIGQARFATLSDDGRRFVAASTQQQTVVYILREQALEKNLDLFRFQNDMAWGVFAPNHAHFLSTSGNERALLWKFDPDFVDSKSAGTLAQVRRYYQHRLLPLAAPWHANN